MSLQLHGVTGRENPTAGSGHSPLVSSGAVFASPTHIPFRDNDNYIAGNLMRHSRFWRVILRDYSKSDEILRYVSSGIDIQEFFTPFKGTF